MSTPSPKADPAELDAFLASAPDGLKAWAQAQREAIAEAPGLEDLGDDDVLDDVRPASRPRSGVAAVNKVLVALLAAAIVILVQQWGRPDPTPPADSPNPHATGEMGGQPVPTLDAERVSQLEAQAKANPADPAVLRELASVYQEAGQWQEANDYRLKLLDLVPDDVDALLAVGVYHFNVGEINQAEQAWRRVVEVAPDKPEGYFNLGFVYLAKEPPQSDEAVAAWEKLIEVAPESELAQTARTHIERVKESQ